MNGSSRIAVAEISLFEKYNQSSCGYGFRKRVVLTEILLAFIWCGSLIKSECRQIKYRIGRT